jgi:hypothetical protein
MEWNARSGSGMEWNEMKWNGMRERECGGMEYNNSIL